MDSRRIEYNPLLIGAPVPISLPAAQWIEVHEFLRYARVPGTYAGQSSPGVHSLTHAIPEAIVTAASLAAHEEQGELAHEQALEAMNPFPHMFQAMREAGFPFPEQGEPE